MQNVRELFSEVSLKRTQFLVHFKLINHPLVVTYAGHKLLLHNLYLLDLFLNLYSHVYFWRRGGVESIFDAERFNQASEIKQNIL